MAIDVVLPFSIASSNAHPHYRDLLREWCVAEWGKVDSFDCSDKGIAIPPPLLAILDYNLIGGLAFTAYPAPRAAEPGLWINVVIVAPEHRRKGVASRLIVAAEAEAIGINATALFVYSSAPRLYQKHGWIEVSRTGETSVLQSMAVQGTRPNLP